MHAELISTLQYLKNVCKKNRCHEFRFTGDKVQVKSTVSVMEFGAGTSLNVTGALRLDKRQTRKGKVKLN